MNVFPPRGLGLIPKLGQLATRPRFASGSSASLVYSSNGDTNGLFYYLGARATGSWSNPITQGLVTISLVPNATYNAGADNVAATYANRSTTTHVDLTGTANISYIIFLGALASFRLTDFTFRWRPDTSAFCPTGWTVYGSNDGSNFTSLFSETGLTPVATAWKYSAVSGADYYKYFKFTQTSSDQPTFLCTGQIEMYGILNSPAI